MDKIKDIKTIINDFNAVADFVTIYIKEAHPVEEWPVFGHRFQVITKHKTLEDRIDAAYLLRNFDIGCPVLVDPMDNQNCLQYAAFPERLYILYDHTIMYFGSVGPFNYKTRDVRKWLQRFRNERNGF
ncbi:Type I iodothyronine deiodinase [Mizuhopecten yessoensis]|uniref:Iodothyronine deiodinase n=1 Tax=Mizuhopecten yessoensis TaxID=6573 RepID=A0A210PX20_MIZYE|nr:Type I iodothyronine deiodinase [Mizuhopecten yessoensis]